MRRIDSPATDARSVHTLRSSDKSIVEGDEATAAEAMTLEEEEGEGRRRREGTDENARQARADRAELSGAMANRVQRRLRARLWSRAGVQPEVSA